MEDLLLTLRNVDDDDEDDDEKETQTPTQQPLCF